jgi:hypothetical protein
VAKLWEMRESSEFDDLGSILHAARCAVLRPVYSDRCTWVHRTSTKYWME